MHPTHQTPGTPEAARAFRYLEHLGPDRPTQVVYLYHLDPPYKHAGHYLGSTDDFDRRDSQHGGPHGARLLQVQKQTGGSWHLVRTWAGGRSKENQLKSNSGKRYCPECTEHPLPGLSTVPRQRKTRRQRAQEQRLREAQATHHQQQEQRRPLWLIERTAVPVTEDPTPEEIALDEMISALEAQWRLQAPARPYGCHRVRGY